MQIRRAQIADVPAMGKIINDCAEFGLMLPRSLASLYENVRDYQVAVAFDSQGGQRVVGVCGLAIVWANLAEVYALAVAPEYRGRGIGKRLVQAVIDEARELGIRKLMTLTYERAFFEKLGFGIIDRQQLPMKVWSECVRCPKNQACDEIAMLRVLKDVPELVVPQPAAPAKPVSMPVLLTSSARRPAALPPEEGD
ncbi:MAG TPA: N-acetyltransferase [Phycisphaeraceae bacterium]